MWSGSYCLMMPHFATISEDEREGFRESIRNCLVSNFQNKNLVHSDVRWSNIGKVLEGSEEKAVIYDLHVLEEYQYEKHEGWIDKAIAYLYPNATDSVDCRR